MKKEIDQILNQVLHPETGKGLKDSEMVESVALSDDRIAITLHFKRNNDPFSKSLSKQLKARLQDAFPKMKGKIEIDVKKSESGRVAAPKGSEKVRRVIAIASGKGGVGKSTVTTNLAVTLATMGYKVGVLDADIYGPSQPRMFGVADFIPLSESHQGAEMIVPAQEYGVKVMSIGFFIAPSAALVWRGPMATSALKQMIHQSYWGELDYLLVDLPPGTGDVHLTILHELKIDGAVIVATPQNVAIDAIRRGIAMFRMENINIPILGLISNMAWFTPPELPKNRYYLFGKGGVEALAESEGLPLLGEIPIIGSIMEGGEQGKPGVITTPQLNTFYQQIAKKIVDNLQ